MRYLIFSDNHYEEARIMSSLSKMHHTWVPHDKANASITHIIVHPDLSALSPSVVKLIADLKQKCKADVVSSDTVVDPSVSKRPVVPEKKQEAVIERISTVDNVWKHPVTILNRRKATEIDPDTTYMAPRQWIKMLPNDDDNAQAPWADQMASQSNQVTSSKQYQSTHSSNVTFKGAVGRVIMANTFMKTFQSTRRKRVEGTVFHEKFRNRKRLTQADTPEALSRRLSELDEALITKRTHDKEMARRERDAIYRDKKFQHMQSKKQAVMLFQPAAGKLAMKLAGKSAQRRATKVFPASPPKPSSPKPIAASKSVTPIPKKNAPPPVVVPMLPDPLTRWRTKTMHRMAGVPDDESIVSNASKISFAAAADAVESVEMERKAVLNNTAANRPSRNRLLDRLKQIKKPTSHRVTMDKLHASAAEVRGVHKQVSLWTDVRGKVTKPPVVIRPRPHTAPTRPSSRAVTPLPPGVITPPTPGTARISSNEPEKRGNNIEQIHQAILEGCSIPK